MRAFFLIAFEHLGFIEFKNYPFDDDEVDRALRIWASIGRLALMGVVVLVETTVASFLDF